jgi:enolase
VLNVVVFQMMSSCISPSPNSHLLDNAKMEERETEDQRKAESVKIAISYINKEINDKLKGMKPFQQKEMDALITYAACFINQRDML